jgi:energy-coupling factor transporter ATP-binding protein EcfA2
MPVGPYGQDVLTRIVNVRWGSLGAVFVSGDEWGFGRHARMKDKDSAQDWTGITKLATASSETDPGTILASSYALVGGDKDNPGIPTFVLGGSVIHFIEDKPPEQHTIIMTSHDGTSWATTLDRTKVLDEGVVGGYVAALVWDKDATTEGGMFYAQIFDESGETTYQSATGLSWGPGGGSFAAHCKGKMPGVPDGVYGYDAGGNILIAPSADGESLDITTGLGTPDEKKTKMTLDFMAVFCVAFAGGIWEAGGNTVLSGPLNTACTASSTDDGQTWAMVSKGALGMHEETGQRPSIMTIIAAPASDFPG